MTDARDAVVGALIVLASSADYRDRADAGRALAVFAEVRQAREPLVTLTLDPRDTFVTRVTTESLLRRHDRFGYVLVARAMAVADDNHADWIHTARDGTPCAGPNVAHPNQLTLVEGCPQIEIEPVGTRRLRLKLRRSSAGGDA